jgi:hypothetical protein
MRPIANCATILSIRRAVYRPGGETRISGRAINVFLGWMTAALAVARAAAARGKQSVVFQ